MKSVLSRIINLLSTHFKDANILLILHPAFILMSVNNEFRLAGMGNTFGCLVLGIMLGLLFIIKLFTLGISFNHLLGKVFIAAPVVLWGISFCFTTLLEMDNTPRYIWILFIFVYLLAGLLLYARTSPKEKDKDILSVSSLCIAYLCFSLFMTLTNSLGYSPDSFSYYDMSQSIFKDFGYVSTVRQYVILTDYGISFPYLFPAFIAVVNFFTGFGLFSGTLINIAVVVISVYLILKISNNVAYSPLPGLAASLILIFNQYYMDEALAARAVPLSLLCVLIIMYIVTASNEMNGKKVFFIGVTAGAGMVIRFDFLIMAAMIGILSVIISIKKKNFKPVIFYSLGLLVFTTPWFLYSIIHFGRIWVSDNFGTMLLINPTIPLRFYLEEEIVPDYFSDPGAWLSSHRNIFIRIIGNVFALFFRQLEMFLILGIVCVGVFSVFKRGSEDASDDKNSKLKYLGLFFSLVYTFKTISIALVGYMDLRYFAEMIIVILTVISCYAYVRIKNNKIWLGFIIAIYLFSLFNYLMPITDAIITAGMNTRFIGTSSAASTPAMEELSQIMRDDSGKDNEEIKLFDISDSLSFGFGPHTGIHTYKPLVNMSEERLSYLIDNFAKPDYLYAVNDENSNTNKWLELLRGRYLITPVTDKYPLYKIMEGATITAANLTDHNWKNGVSLETNVLLFPNNELFFNLLLNSKPTIVTAEGGSAKITNVKEMTSSWIWVEIAEGSDKAAFEYPALLSFE